MPIAWHSRAGPEASCFGVPRRAAAISSPATIRPARSKTADAVPAGPHTRLTQKCMPYVKYTYACPGGPNITAVRGV